MIKKFMIFNMRSTFFTIHVKKLKHIYPYNSQGCYILLDMYGLHVYTNVLIIKEDYPNHYLEHLEGLQCLVI